MQSQQEFLENFTEQLIINSEPQSIVEKLKKIKQENKQIEIQEKIKKPREIKINKGITKIAPILDNPEITEIECPGFEKYLIIEKANTKIPLHIILSKQEIKNIINYFSEKTNTQITKPVYKTTFNNMVLTAIISEFGGYKFIITKILPNSSKYL